MNDRPSRRGRTSEDPSAIKIIPVRHPGRWVAGFVIVVLAAMPVHTLSFSNVVRGGQRAGRFQWRVVCKYLFATPVMRGIGVTLELTVIAMAVGIIVGVILAVMRLSPNRLLSGSAWIYLWFFRGTPVFVQLIFWYEGISYLYPHLSFGIPFIGPDFLNVNANMLVTTFVAAALGLSLNEGAYMAEIVRAGIISVDEGQTEAAQTIGMTKAQTLRAYRPAPGHARHHPAHGKRDHLHAQDHIVGLCHRRSPTSSVPPRTSPTSTTRSSRF